MTTSLIPRLSGMQNIHMWRVWYILSRDHDVIKIGPEFLEQKGNVLRIIQPQRSMCMIFTPR